MIGVKAEILSRVARVCREKALFPVGSTVLAAVSGGADSVSLLLILLALQDTLDIRVEAAHYEHGIRGEASREDARFVQAMCAERGVRCHVGHGDVPALARGWKCSLEDAARRARYAFLEQAAREVGAARIVLAHQLEDQAETLLLHLVHGCGLDGLAAMRPLSGNRARPLLDIPREMLIAYLNEIGVPWREDATNLDTAHARNLLRHEVFPVLCRINPRAAEAIGRTAAQAALAADTLRGVDTGALSGRVKRMPYGAYWLLPDQYPAASACRLFARMAGIPALEARHAEAMATLSVNETANLPGGWRALRTGTRLHLLAGDQTATEPADAHPPWTEMDFAWTEGGAAGYGDGIREQTFDAEALQGAHFRARRDGDVFAPLGGTGTQKLKQTLRDAGIDQPFRDLLPVLARGNRVLWIVGLKPSRDAAVRENTCRTVTIAYTGDLPWEIER